MEQHKTAFKYQAPVWSVEGINDTLTKLFEGVPSAHYIRMELNDDSRKFMEQRYIGSRAFYHTEVEAYGLLHLKTGKWYTSRGWRKEGLPENKDIPMYQAPADIVHRRELIEKGGVRVPEVPNSEENYKKVKEEFPNFEPVYSYRYRYYALKDAKGDLFTQRDVRSKRNRLVHQWANPSNRFTKVTNYGIQELADDRRRYSDAVEALRFGIWANQERQKTVGVGDMIHFQGLLKEMEDYSPTGRTQAGKTNNLQNIPKTQTHGTDKDNSKPSDNICRLKLPRAVICEGRISTGGGEAGLTRVGKQTRLGSSIAGDQEGSGSSPYSIFNRSF